MYKIASPVTGPLDWGNPEVLFEAGSLQLPNGLVWDMTKKKAWYCDTIGVAEAKHREGKIVFLIDMEECPLTRGISCGRV